MNDNIALFLIATLCSMALLLGWVGKAGTVGNAISNTLFGLFGTSQYILTIMLPVVVFLVLFRPHTPFKRRATGIALLLFSLSVLGELLSNKTSLEQIYVRCAAFPHIGGGAICGYIAMMGTRYFGRVIPFAVDAIFILCAISILRDQNLFLMFFGKVEDRFYTNNGEQCKVERVEPIETIQEPINLKTDTIHGKNLVQFLPPKHQKKVVKEEEREENTSLPSTSLLSEKKESNVESNIELEKTAAKLQETLNSFDVQATVTQFSQGPTVTRFEVTVGTGVKVSKITSLENDIKLNLAASEIRIEAPIPGKAAVGIEIPNKKSTVVTMREMLECEEYRNSKAALSFAIGKDIAGNPVVADIESMPHLLIAGATGSGKSVCINTLITSLLYKYSPDEVRMVMIDPKMVELKIYDSIPHLLMPVVTDVKEASNTLKELVDEMENRYRIFAEHPGVRDIVGYNKFATKNGLKTMPRIVAIIDELADMMMTAPKKVETLICRLAQLARAAGIHLVIATQRPSVNVVTGLIKANMPSRIALAMSSSVDSRTIIDMGGAEHLLGRGDMLFYPQNYSSPKRIQGAYISDEEVANLVGFFENKEKKTNNVSHRQKVEPVKIGKLDDLYTDAGKLIIEKQKASTDLLQKTLKVGFKRAQKIMEQLCANGVVGESNSTKPREILMTLDEFESSLDNGDD